MNDPMVIAAAFVLVIAAVGGAVVQIINAKAAAEDRKEAKIMRARLQDSADKTDIKTDAIIKQGVEIHASTNSNLSKVTENLNVALEEINGLKKLVYTLTEAKKTADTLALSQERKIRVTDEPAKILEDIKINTGEAVTELRDLKEKI